MKYLALLLLLASCSLQPEPGIDPHDYTEETHSKRDYFPRDTYTVVVSYNSTQPNDTLVDVLYKHWPTNADIIPEFSTRLPSFKAPDNEWAHTYLNVKGVNVIKATVSANNEAYIREQLQRQDSIMRAGK